MLKGDRDTVENMAEECMSKQINQHSASHNDNIHIQMTPLQDKRYNNMPTDKATQTYSSLELLAATSVRAVRECNTLTRFQSVRFD